MPPEPTHRHVRPRGTYSVSPGPAAQLDADLSTTGNHTITITTRGDVIAGVNFGNMPLPGACPGIKWNDLDGDGVKDPREPGIAGVYIYADLNNDGRSRWANRQR